MVKVIKSSSMASRGAKKTVKIRELPACTQFDQRSAHAHTIWPGAFEMRMYMQPVHVHCLWHTLPCIDVYTEQQKTA
eukprot:1156152-Pelagomonas_calceolata.AAC.7